VGAACQWPSRRAPHPDWLPGAALLSRRTIKTPVSDRPTGPVSSRLCPKPPHPAVRARPSAAPLLAPPHKHLCLLRTSMSPTPPAAIRYRSRLPSPFRQRRCCPEHRTAAPRRHPHPPGPRWLDPSSEPPDGGLPCRGLPRPPHGPSSSLRTSPSRSSLRPSWPPPRPGSAPTSSRLSLRSRHASSAPAPASHPTTLILSPSRSRASLLVCRHCASHAIAPRAPFAAALVGPTSPLSGAFILESSRAKNHPRASALLPLPPLPPRRGPHHR
jgi:hypothetical protein